MIFHLPYDWAHELCQLLWCELQFLCDCLRWSSRFQAPHAQSCQVMPMSLRWGSKCLDFSFRCVSGSGRKECWIRPRRLKAMRQHLRSFGHNATTCHLTIFQWWSRSGWDLQRTHQIYSHLPFQGLLSLLHHEIIRNQWDCCRCFPIFGETAAKRPGLVFLGPVDHPWWAMQPNNWPNWPLYFVLKGQDSNPSKKIPLKSRLNHYKITIRPKSPEKVNFKIVRWWWLSSIPSTLHCGARETWWCGQWPSAEFERCHGLKSQIT